MSRFGGGAWSSFGRPEEGRILGGVCQGLSDRFAIDPTLVRLAFLVLAFAWGLGVILYLALWFLMPGPGDDPNLSLSSRARERFHGARFDLDRSARGFKARWSRLERDPWPRPLGRRWLALLLVAGGFMLLLATFGAFSWLNVPRALSLAVIIAGAAILFTMRRDAR